MTWLEKVSKAFWWVHLKLQSCFSEPGPKWFGGTLILKWRKIPKDSPRCFLPPLTEYLSFIFIWPFCLYWTRDVAIPHSFAETCVCVCVCLRVCASWSVRPFIEAQKSCLKSGFWTEKKKIFASSWNRLNRFTVNRFVQTIEIDSFDWIWFIWFLPTEAIQ